MPTEAPTGSQHHKAATLAAVKTNTLAIEREVKEKFALSPLNTSGCWWVISLTRTFSLATNWLRKEKKTEQAYSAAAPHSESTLQIYHQPFTEIPPNKTANEWIIVASVSIRHRQQLVGQMSLWPKPKIDLKQQMNVKTAHSDSVSNIDFLTNPSITGLGLQPQQQCSRCRCAVAL